MPTFEALSVDDSPSGRTSRINSYNSSLPRHTPIVASRPGPMHPIIQYIYAMFSALAAFLVSLRPSSSSSIFSQQASLLINNRQYKVVKQLGEGGFSFVFLVKDMSRLEANTSPTDGLFALKRIAVQLPEHEERLKNEIAAHGCVSDSPFVVKLVDSQRITDANGSVTEGRLLLPYFKNGTIQDMIDKTPVGEFIPLDQILRVGIDICKGLQAFHSRTPPLAFRDLKPANVLLGDHNNAVLMDLGSVTLARLQIKSRREAVALQELCAETVTAPFRAPELFDPASDTLITEAVDIWALGCTLYAMAYRTSPFDGTMTAVINCKLLFPPNDPYGPQFRAVMEGIIQSKPTSRPSANQVEQLLTRFLGSVTVQV
ncbi:Serine/threonine-protein kinase env7 [Batrachochytrium dendrobatidis]